MTHTEYNELTGLLKKIAGDADILRAVFDKVEVRIDDPSDRRRVDEITKEKVASDQARQHTRFKMRYIDLRRTENDVKRAVDVMNKCVDGWSESNQARADQAKTVTADDRALYEAMSSFISATENPIEGVGGVYSPLRSRCRSWMDQATSWFADLNAREADNATGKVMTDSQREKQAFKEELFASLAYKQAVDDQMITPPNTWNKTKRALVDWLLDSNLIPFDIDRHDLRHPRWSIMDYVFVWHKNGKLITNLNDTYQHMKE